MIEQQALQLFENFTGKKADEFKALAQSGSARLNFVAKSSEKTYIVTANGNIPENEAFFYFSNVFKSLNLNTPEIFEISADRKIYIQEFVGENTLSDVISEEGLSERVKSLVKQTLKELYRLQRETEEKIDYQKTFEYQRYDERPILNDLFYFKSFIADTLEIPYHKSKLISEFLEISNLIKDLHPKVLMIRDFQSRNIMVNHQNKIFFIDYQSAMLGPAMYDVVSFLYQAKANFPEDFKKEMLNFYYSLFESDERENLKCSLEPIKMMRFLQVLGAYGFRGLVQKKPHFLSSLDNGINNIAALANGWKGFSEFAELKSLVLQLNSDFVKEKISIIKKV